jgi:hypothetical protein
VLKVVTIKRLIVAATMLRVSAIAGFVLSAAASHLADQVVAILQLKAAIVYK